MAHNRVVQWATMARTWWLFDAKYQCPHRSAEKICMYLEGRHKPLYHPLSDVGDHVVVVNTKHVAMVDDLWRKLLYEHDTRYAGGKSKITAWHLHEADPTKIMYKAVHHAGPKNLLRPNLMRRLHLYPEESLITNSIDPDEFAQMCRFIWIHAGRNHISSCITPGCQTLSKVLDKYLKSSLQAHDVPEDILGNVTDVIRQIQVVPKTLDDYSKEEIEAFPKLFDWPKDYVLFKRKTLEQQMQELEKAKLEAQQKKVQRKKK